MRGGDVPRNTAGVIRHSTKVGHPKLGSLGFERGKEDEEGGGERH